MSDAVLWGEYLDTEILAEQKAKVDKGEMNKQTYSATKSRKKKILQGLQAEHLKFLKWRNIAMTKAPPTAEQLFLYNIYSSSTSHITALTTIQRYTRGYIIRKNMDEKRPALSPQYKLARILYNGEHENYDLINRFAKDINGSYGCREQRIFSNSEFEFAYPHGEDSEEIYNKTAQSLIPHLPLFKKALEAKRVFKTFYHGDRYSYKLYERRDENKDDEGQKIEKGVGCEWRNKWESVDAPIIPDHPHFPHKKMVLFGSNEMNRYIQRLVLHALKYHKHEHPYPQNIIGRKSRERYNFGKKGHNEYFFKNIMRMDMNYCHKTKHEWFGWTKEDIYGRLVFKQ